MADSTGASGMLRARPRELPYSDGPVTIFGVELTLEVVVVYLLRLRRRPCLEVDAVYVLNLVVERLVERVVRRRDSFDSPRDVVGFHVDDRDRTVSGLLMPYRMTGDAQLLPEDS